MQHKASRCRVCNHSDTVHRTSHCANAYGHLGWNKTDAMRVSPPGEIMKARYLPLVPALLALNGCVIEGRHSGPVQYSSESVEMDDSESVRVEMRMGAGDLRV